jgi:hypothetical protein
MAIWHDLDSHYEKHPDGVCKLCWSIALGKPPSIPKPDYKDVPDKLRLSNWLNFEGDYSEFGGSSVRCQYFVDERMIVSIFTSSSLKVRTTFRFHSPKNAHGRKVTHVEYHKFIERYGDRMTMRGAKSIRPIQVSKIVHKNPDLQRTLQTKLNGYLAQRG